MVGGGDFVSSTSFSDTETLTVGDSSWTTLSYILPVQIGLMASASLDNKIFIMGMLKLIDTKLIR